MLVFMFSNAFINNKLSPSSYPLILIEDGEAESLQREERTDQRAKRMP